MSKGNMFLGYARGKVGDIVFSRRMGEQITRAYNAHPNDANSIAQVTQRTQLANLVNMYRAVRTLLDHSFTNRKEEQSSYNRFVSRNLNITKVYLTKDQSRAGACVIAPYVVSEGLLPAIQVTGTGDNVTTNINLGDIELTSATTIAEFTAALLDNNASLSEGDKLTFIALTQGTDATNGYPIVLPGYHSITLDLSSSEKLYDYMPTYAVQNIDGVLGLNSIPFSGGYCWIRSNKDSNGKLQASTQSLILTSDTTFSSFSSVAQLSAALQSYNAADEKLLEPGSDESSEASSGMTVSSVSINSTVLAEQSYIYLNADGTDTILINGSNLASVSTAQLRAGFTTGSYTAWVTFSIDGATTTDTSIQGTLTPEVSGSHGNYTEFAVILDDKTVFSWSATGSSSGGETPDPSN